MLCLFEIGDMRILYIYDAKFNAQNMDVRLHTEPGNDSKVGHM